MLVGQGARRTWGKGSVGCSIWNALHLFPARIIFDKLLFEGIRLEDADSILYNPRTTSPQKPSGKDGSWPSSYSREHQACVQQQPCNDGRVHVALFKLKPLQPCFRLKRTHTHLRYSRQKISRMEKADTHVYAFVDTNVYLRSHAYITEVRRSVR